MIEPERTVLWSATTVQQNNTSIELLDSIDNYDELIYFGSGTRTYTPCVMTEYPVISGQLNLGGPFFFGNWGATDTYVLCNGTQVFLSGNSGFVASSYFWGKNNASTAYAASLTNNSTNDVRPYMIVGVKYPSSYDRTLIWSSDHTQSLYNTNITLSEPITHFRNFVVLGSGFEDGGVGCRHASKNIYNVIPLKIQGCDAWAYTPWKIQEKHNLLIGQEMRISGDSGYIGSGYYMGMGNQTTAWAAGKWGADYQFSATAPYKIYGLNRKPTHKLKLLHTTESVLSASDESGYEYDITTLTATVKRGWELTGYALTGATLTGNEFMWNDEDVSAQALCSVSPVFTVTILTADHGDTVASESTGYRGDIITLTSTPDEGWYYAGYNTTGCIINQNQFILTADAIIQPKYSVSEPPTITLYASEGGTVTANSLIGVPGDTVELTTTYEPYNRFSGYVIDGDGTIEDNTFTFGNEDCIVCAFFKPNTFTASGEFEKGNDISWQYTASIGGSTTVPAKYALCTYMTDNVPAEWYSDNNRWKVNDVSAYAITLNPVMHFSGWGGQAGSIYVYARYTGYSLVGDDISAQDNASFAQANTWDFNRTYTSDTQDVYYRLSGLLWANGSNAQSTYAKAQYLTAGSTGTWTATGIAP